mmetsp:Transcript_6361/g.8275  ORF Transcript_6361/g.8275 Transcript_6361/m.8275 type:complete len:110 (+) Transcript_6361:168-497(+)
MASSPPKDIRADLEQLVAIKHRQQKEGSNLPPETPTTTTADDEQQQSRRMVSPNKASPNMNAEMAQAAAAQFKKKEKSIQHACAKVDKEKGNKSKQQDNQASSSCCVIL